MLGDKKEEMRTRLTKREAMEDRKEGKTAIQDGKTVNSGKKNQV